MEISWATMACLLAVLPCVAAAAAEEAAAWPSSEGCKDPAIAEAMEAVRAAIPRAAKDPTRPVYHFRPPAQWMNDICGALYHKGNYHVFYQLNPFGDTWGSKGSSWGHARSKDLVHWEHLPIAIVPSSDRGELRCNSGCVALNGEGMPMIFYTFVPQAKGRKREQWAAIACDDELLTWRKLDENPLMAAGVLFDAKGRCILFGWVSGFEAGRGWNGCMSLPRVLTLDGDARPIQTPAPELAALRGKHIRVGDLALNDRGHVLEGARGDTLEVLAELEPGTAKAVGLKLRSLNEVGLASRLPAGKMPAPPSHRAVVLRYDGHTLDVDGTPVPLTLDDKQRTLTLHVFLDKSAMEVFINGGRECVTRVIYPGQDALGIEVFAQGGPAVVRSLDVWHLGSIWPRTDDGWLSPSIKGR